MLANSLNQKVSHLGEWIDGEWGWFVRWRICSNFHWDLSLLLTPVKPRHLVMDSFVWWRNATGFTVRNWYNCILKHSTRTSVLDFKVSLVLVNLWKTKLPSLILILGARLIWNRLPSKSELLKRGELSGAYSLVCPL